jgi:SAM-dependent methyltransferase
MKPLFWNQDLVASYDRAAERYAEMFADELERKPFDRALLEEFALEVRGSELVCDLGCGVGHISRYLKARGVSIFGIDLSPRMIEIASQLNPDIPFRQGDMLALDLHDQALTGVVAFYSLIHFDREAVRSALKEINRVLHPDGRLLLSVHGGEGEIHTDEFLGLPVSLDVTLFQLEEIGGYVEQADFSVDKITARPPYDFEYQSTRIYVSAKK